MKNYKIYTIALLLFTVSTLASCIESPAKTTKFTAKASNVSNKKATHGTDPVIKRLNANDFNSELNLGKVQLVDVRTPREFTQGHIEGAVNMNMYASDFKTKTATLDKSKPVYVYCRSGARSMRTAKTLQKSGFNVVNLNGGTMGWSRAGFKLIK